MKNLKLLWILSISFVFIQIANGTDLDVIGFKSPLTEQVVRVYFPYKKLSQIDFERSFPKNERGVYNASDSDFITVFDQLGAPIRIPNPCKKYSEHPLAEESVAPVVTFPYEYLPYLVSADFDNTESEYINAIFITPVDEVQKGLGYVSRFSTRKGSSSLEFSYATIYEISSISITNPNRYPEHSSE